MSGHIPLPKGSWWESTDGPSRPGPRVRRTHLSTATTYRPPGGWGEQSGEAHTLSEVAEREGMDRAYVSRMVNLTTLAPDIVAATLDESPPPEVRLFDPGSGTPLLWDEQRRRLHGAGMT